MRSPSAAELCFVVPALDGPITGGTLYNRELITALRALTNARVSSLALDAPGIDAALETARWVWVDSLYLAHLPELKRRSFGQVGVIAHYLPSFVKLARAVALAELSDEERRAVLCADAFWVTSDFMRDACEKLVAPSKKPILVVEPGTDAVLSELRSRAIPSSNSELHAILVGNVTEGKGIESWLRELDAALAPDDRLRVTIVGSLVAEPAYAERCRALVRDSRLLAARVTFAGALSRSGVRELLLGSQLFVSASRMESYGMALSEARVLGVPILARVGGNAAAHVDPRAGGELAKDEPELARACVRLARNEAARAERLALARAHAPLARPWAGAAREFLAQLAAYEK